MKPIFKMIMKMGFLISRCWQFAFAFCISISAADLPEDLKQIRNYFNNPPAITNLTFVMTNYISRPFLNDDEIREAMKNGYDPNKPRVSYWAYSSDPDLPGIVYRSFPAEHFDANHNLTNLAILTNHSRPDFYTGRSNHIWWTAEPEKICNLSFNILTNSPDGLQMSGINSTQISTHFRDWIFDNGSVFQHFGFGMFEAGSWKVEKDLTSTNLFKWRGVSKIYGEISGISGQTAFSEQPEKRYWLLKSKSPKCKLNIRLDWDNEARMPRQFLVVDHFENEGGVYEKVLRSFTKVDSPMLGWRDYPDAFHFTYHTNSGNLRGNMIVLNSTNGARSNLPVGVNRFDPDYDRRPLFSSKFLRFVLFIFTFGCIGLFLWRRVLQKKQWPMMH